MIVATVARGASFKGVTAYLHSANENDHRAEFTAMQNIGTANPYMAARVMAATAMDAEAIKLANGWNGKGRKSTDQPVYHAIMSWDETRHPDIEHQEQTAREMLKAVGLDRAQAIIVGHNDNQKTHVHVVVNLIDPETGKQFSLSNDRRKMQTWALEYCKANGIDIEKVAPNRAKNAEKRAELAMAEPNTKTAPVELEGNKRLSRNEWLAMKDELFKRQAEERGILKGLHGKDWEDAKAEIAKRTAISKRLFSAEYRKQKAEAKEINRPKWRAFFQEQKAERAKIEREMGEAVTQYRKSRSLAGRIMSGLGLGQRVDQAQAKLATVQMNLATMHGQQEQAQRAFSKELSQDIFERTKQAVEPLERLDLAGMKDRHQADRDRLRERHLAEREKAGVKTREPVKPKAQDNTPPRKENDRTKRADRLQAMKDRGLSDRAKAEIEKMRRRDRKNRERGQDRGRDR